MPWTREQKLQALMRLPWTVRSSRDPDDGSFLAGVAELPSVIATGATEKELEASFWESLEATLSRYLDAHDPIPLPVGAHIPWLPAAGEPERTSVNFNLSAAGTEPAVTIGSVRVWTYGM